MFIVIFSNLLYHDYQTWRENIVALRA